MIHPDPKIEDCIQYPVFEELLAMSVLFESDVLNVV